MNKTDQTLKWKKNFFIIAIGQSFSLIGSSAVQFALMWWLASETSSPMVLAISGLAAFLPQILLGSFAGVWIDRLKRKVIVICADLFIGFTALLFALYFLIGNPPYWSAFIVIGVRSIGNVFHTPAIQSIIPMLVPKDKLIKANGWSQFMESGAFMLGPALGAVMYSAFPFPIILLSDFIGAVIASITVGIIKIPEIERQEKQIYHFFREFKEGINIFLNDKKFFIVTLAVMLCMIFFMPLSSFYPLMTSSYFKLDSIYAGIVEVLFALGMMISSLLIGLFGKIRHKFSVIYLGLLGIGITSFICGIVSSNMNGFYIFSFSCFIMGLSGNIYSIPYTAYIQENIPNQLQGRIFSLITSLMSLTMPIGLLISGPFAEKYGVSLWFSITGIAFFIIIFTSILYIKTTIKKTK